MSETEGQGLSIDDAPVGVLSMTLDGVVLGHNMRVQEWLGVPRDEGVQGLIGRKVMDWLTPSSQLLYETRIVPQLLARGKAREVILEVANPDGQRVPLLMNAEVKITASGDREVRAALILAPGRVAFERELVAARRAAEAATSRLALLQDATSRLALSTGLDDLGEVLVSSALRATHASWASVRVGYAYSRENSAEMRTWGTSPLAPSTRVSPENFVSEQVACRTRSDILSQLPIEGPQLAKAGVESLVITPIFRTSGQRDEVIGELSCWFQRGRTLEDEVLDVLTAVTTQAELVLDHLSLQEQVRHHALHDGLTGLANRLLLNEQIGQMLDASSRSRDGLAVLFLDLDGFKSINDTYGHAVGDEVLREVAARLRASCRAGEIVSRLGGDEFVVAVTGVDRDTVTTLAHRIWQAIRAPLTGAAAGAPLSSSVGVMLWEPADGVDAPSAQQLVSAADEAMYRAKRSGRDAVLVDEWPHAVMSS